MVITCNPTAMIDNSRWRNLPTLSLLISLSVSLYVPPPSLSLSKSTFDQESMTKMDPSRWSPPVLGRSICQLPISMNYVQIVAPARKTRERFLFFKKPESFQISLSMPMNILNQTGDLSEIWYGQQSTRLRTVTKKLITVRGALMKIPGNHLKFSPASAFSLSLSLSKG